MVDAEGNGSRNDVETVRSHTRHPSDKQCPFPAHVISHRVMGGHRQRTCGLVHDAFLPNSLADVANVTDLRQGAVDATGERCAMHGGVWLGEHDALRPQVGAAPQKVGATAGRVLTAKGTSATNRERLGRLA